MNSARLLGLAWLAVLLGGCGMPRDPQGTLEEVRGGDLRVGVIDHLPWADMEQGQPRGSEVELVKAFADRLEARCVWVPGAESELLEALTRGELHLVVGGLTDSTPWVDRVGLSQPYSTVDGRGHVVAVPSGENRWLLEIDKFLQSHPRKPNSAEANP